MRAEIKRRIEQFKKERNKIPSEMSKSFDIISLGARIAALEEILVFVSSLPAEPSEEFKEEFNNFCVHGDIRNPNFEGPFGYDDIRNTAIHFARWQKDILLNRACEWLRKHVLEYFDNAGVEISTFTENFITAMEDEQ